ncbi:MAG TPA: ABC transporter permease [Lachnospiraceae bacterium]|nr:ABC transporter permease [Lachnospiraceae bacterium]
MKTITQLIKRNMLVYCKNRANLFFSFLTMFIIIALQLVFLGNMNVKEVESTLANLGGVRDVAQDHANAVNLIYSWVIAGILVVNSVTVTLNVIGIMTEDEDKKRLTSFFVAPISRTKLIISYISTGIIMGIFFSLVALLISEIVIVAAGGYLLSVSQLLKAVGLLVIIVFSAACLTFFIAIFVHSVSAFNGLSTVIGTLIGFVTALYLPMGMLPESVQNVLKLFPILHGSSLMRSVFTERAVADTFHGLPEIASKQYNDFMGMSLTWGTTTISDITKVIILLGSGIIFMLLSFVILKRRSTADR